MSDDEWTFFDTLARPFRVLRGDCYWDHERPGAYVFARLVCALFGHAAERWTDAQGRWRGDCRRCWG